MGIERVLKEKFGDAIKDIRQVIDEQVNETTVEVCFFLNVQYKINTLFCKLSNSTLLF